MRDVVFASVTVGFFALAAAYVRGCAAVVGDEGANDAHDEVAS